MKKLILIVVALAFAFAISSCCDQRDCVKKEKSCRKVEEAPCHEDDLEEKGISPERQHRRW